MASTPTFFGLARAAAIALAASVALLAPPAPAPAQQGAPERRVGQQSPHERDSLDAFSEGDHAEAERILRDWIDEEPNNFVPWYNLACALALQEKTEEAERALARAVELGFADLAHMINDGDLRNLRETETFISIVENWDLIEEARIDARLERARQRYGPRYTYERDDDLRLAYVSGFDRAAFERAKEEIDRLVRWWDRHVLPERDPPPRRQNLLEQEDTWVKVLLPTREDYARWAARRYGPAWRQIGGTYSHDQKLLIAQDLGSTMRHEFWHVLHWRHMDRLGQRHPIWIMEGLCSLVEDVREGAGGEMIVLPSWRSNIAGRLARGGSLTPWEQLFEVEHARFVGSRPLAHYAQARTVFHFLADRGKLRDWYTAYVHGYHEDPTGLSAFEEVFGTPVDRVESQYRAWLRELPEAPEEIDRGAAAMPFELSPGQGDGVEIASFASSRQARASGLRPRDVITAVQGEPVREMTELVRVLSRYQPGQTIEVDYRRGRLHRSTRVELVEQR